MAQPLGSQRGGVRERGALSLERRRLDSGPRAQSGLAPVPVTQVFWNPPTHAHAHPLMCAFCTAPSVPQ